RERGRLAVEAEDLDPIVERLRDVGEGASLIAAAREGARRGPAWLARVAAFLALIALALALAVERSARACGEGRQDAQRAEAFEVEGARRERTRHGWQGTPASSPAQDFERGVAPSPGAGVRRVRQLTVETAIEPKRSVPTSGHACRRMPTSGETRLSVHRV